MKAFQTRLKDVEEESSTMKKFLIKENRTLYKSFSAEVKKLEQRNQNNDTKIKQYKRKLELLKEDNKELAAALQDKRRKSRLTIAQLLDDAERVIMEAKGIKQAADATINLYRQNLRKKRQYHACQITKRESFFILQCVSSTQLTIVLCLCSLP